jgi:hypothetical protein
MEAGVQVDREQSGRRRWIRRWWPARAGGPIVGPVNSRLDDGRVLVPAADGELTRQLEAVGTQERHRLTDAARPALAALLSAEPQLERVELDRERGSALLAFADGTLLRAAAARPAHPALERLASRLRWDPVYLAGARISAEGGVLLRLVCGAFWPMEIGPLVPASG